MLFLHAGGRARRACRRASGGGAGVDFQVFSEHLPPTSPICRHLPRFSLHFLLHHTHINAHPVKNNQQPPISFWHAKEGTLKKSTKCCAKLSSILFQVGYTVHYGCPLISTSPPPTELRTSPVDLAALVRSSAESWPVDSCSESTRMC